MLKYLVGFIDEDYFEFKDNLKNSILNLVVSYGDLDLVKYVISLNPTVSQLNNKNAYGIFRFIFTLCSTFIAAMAEYYDVFKYLCSLDGVDVNCTDCSKITPLHYCAKRDLICFVNILIKHKRIILNPKDIDDVLFITFYKTPLDLSREAFHTRMTKYLENIYKINNIL